MRLALHTALLVGLAAQAQADGSADLSRRLEGFRSPGGVGVTLQLDLHLERTLHQKTARGETSLSLGVEQDATGLKVRWEPSVLRAADAESHERDQSPDRLTPVREALKELDPARLAHLLDQAGTLAG